MTDVKKFLFDKNDFNDADNPADRPIYTEAQLLLAKEQGFNEGKSAGLNEAKQHQEALIAQIMQKTLNLTEGLVKNEDRREIEKSINAIKLAMKITAKLLPGFAEKYAVDEIENIITKSIETRKDEPRIAVTVPTAHLEYLKSRVDALAAEKGYPGKIILLTDDNLTTTDCRVEWADGGAERLYAQLVAQIEKELAKTITGLDHQLGGVYSDSLKQDHKESKINKPSNLTASAEEQKPEAEKTVETKIIE